LNKIKEAVLKRSALCLIAIVLITRVGFLLFFGHTLSLNTSGYDAYAVNLLAGHGYTRFADLHPDTDLPPLYSFTLAAIYLIGGRSAIAVAVVQIAFEAGTVLLIWRIGWLIGGATIGRSVGLLAGLFTALYPYQLFQDLTVNDTAIFILLLSVALYWAAVALHRDPADRWDRSQVGRWALCGLLIGIGALTKTLILLTIPLIAIGAWTRFGFRRAIAAALIVGGIAALTIAPWMIRNTVVNRAFTLISTNDGSNFYQANNPCAIQYMEAGWDVQWVVYAGCLTTPPVGLSDIQLDRFEMQQGLDYLKANIAVWPRLLADKFLVLWSPDLTPAGLPPALSLNNNDPVEQYNTPLFEAARFIHRLYFTPLLILALIGLILCIRQRRPITPIVAALIMITFAYLIYHPSTRYRAPVDPLLFILSAYALVKIANRIAPGNSPYTDAVEQEALIPRPRPPNSA